jgi:hypothetical protein
MTNHYATRPVPETAWFKSSYSDGGGGECIEVAPHMGAIHVRDSKNVTGPAVTVSRKAWANFLDLTAAERPNA